MLLVLETLAPEERAVFVLREAFGTGYDEIAAATGRPVATVRQIAHRAREHVRARRPRFTAPRTGPGGWLRRSSGPRSAATSRR